MSWGGKSGHLRHREGKEACSNEKGENGGEGQREGRRSGNEGSPHRGGERELGKTLRIPLRGCRGNSGDNQKEKRQWVLLIKEH